MLKRVPQLLMLMLAPALLHAQTTIPILAYHQVETEPKLGWSVRTGDFNDQMTYLAAAGYHVVSIADAYEYLAGKRDAIPSNPVVITVDDGFADSYAAVFPTLKRFGFPWSLYIYPKFVSYGRSALQWAQVVEMSAAGVDVESHTVTHPHLPRKAHAEMTDAVYAGWLQHELADSKSVIEKKIGKPVRFLAYPYGDWDAGVEQAAARAGYLLALTSWAETNKRGVNLFELRRFPMESDTTFAGFTKAVGAIPLEVRDAVPENDTVAQPTTISATIAGPADLDPSTVRMTILGESGTANFDANTGRITYSPGRSKRSQRRVIIYGNRASDHRPVAASWTFYSSAEAKAQYEATAARLHELPLHHTQTKRE